MPEADTVLYLSSAQTRLACRDLDPVATVRETLVRYANARSRPSEPAGDAGIVVPGPASADDPEHRAGHRLALLFDGPAGISAMIAADYLTVLSRASATVAIAHRLASAGVMMVGVLGADPLVEVFAEVLAASRPGLVHIAIYDADSTSAHALGDRMGGPLRRYGVGVSVAASGRDAALGANLVVTATVPASGQARYEWLHRGALLVNSSRGDLSNEIVRRCDILLVDDVFGGRHPGRRGHDEVIAVHLAGLEVADVALANQVHRIAARRGLGVRLPW